jgi:SAM-dependent methyltransferase
MHLSPRPTTEELTEYYQEEYFDQEKPDYSAEHNAIHEYWEEVYGEQLEVVISKLKPCRLHGIAIYEGPSRVLDAGCGRDPLFLKSLKRIAPQLAHMPQGLEPSLPERTRVGDIELYRNWEELPFPGFDVINMGFVLEHAFNPFELLLKAHEHLFVGGVLLAEVPYDFNPVQDRLDHYECVSTPDHVNYFNPRSLYDLLKRCGFRVEEMRTTYPVELFKLSGLDYSCDEAARKLLNDRRHVLQRFWAQSGCSRVPSYQMDGRVEGRTVLGRTVWAVASKRA